MIEDCKVLKQGNSGKLFNGKNRWAPKTLTFPGKVCKRPTMYSRNGFTFPNLFYSQSQSFSSKNQVSEIKKMLLSGDEQEKTCAVSNVLSQMADSDGAIEMINSDICEFLCAAMLPFDSAISETIYNCLEVMVRFEEFFTHNHSSVAIESVIRSINHLIKNGAYDSTIRYPLQTLKVIVQRSVEFNKPPDITFENLMDLLSVLLKNNPAEEVKYQTGEIIKFLLDIESRNLKIISNLGDICEKWFDVICVKNDNSKLTKRIVDLGCAVSEQTLRYLCKEVASHVRENKNPKSVERSNVIKKIITFLLEFSFPYIQIEPYAVEKQEVQRLEHYFTSFSFILKDSPDRQLITKKLSAMGCIQLIFNTMSFSYYHQYKKLGETCMVVLTEILLSLSDDVFVFPDMWPEGRDHFMNEIIKGLSVLSLDSTRWAENLVETDTSPSARLALIVYFFFYFLTCKSPEGAEEDYSMAKFVNASLRKDSPPLLVKLVWFLFATLQMSQNSLSPGFKDWENKKLVGILESQENFSLIYTHHPIVLNWAFSSTIIDRKIQCEVVKLWLEQSSADCTVLDDLAKKSFHVRLVIFEILRDEHEHSTHLAFICLRNFMLESDDEALTFNIWLTLAQTLEKYMTDAISVIKVDYTIELASLKVPDNPDMCNIVQIASSLPKALEKTDLISLTPALKLCLQLLQLSVAYEEPGVFSAFLRCEKFMQKILSAIDMNLSELALTSLKFVSILWSKPENFPCTFFSCRKVILDVYSILNILGSMDLELVKMGLALLEQMLATNFQSHFFTVEGVSSDLMKIIFFDLENILIKYMPLISGPVWLCLTRCLSSNDKKTLAEDALLHEVISYCLPYLKDTPEMMDFLVVWMERRIEGEKYFSHYSPIQESYFTITVRGIAAFLAENNFENSERLCQKILDCCDHFFIDSNQDPFNKIRARTIFHADGATAQTKLSTFESGIESCLYFQGLKLKMLEVKHINLYLILSCLTGSLVSYYAYTVEMKAEADHNYVALCDISEHMSCTKAFSSEYGRGFGVIGQIFGEDSILNQPNSFGGIFFYLILAGLCTFDNRRAVKFQIFLAVVSNILSVYLAYILYFILYDFCIVCVTTYIINALNLFLLLLKWKKFHKFSNEGAVPHLKRS